MTTQLKAAAELIESACQPVSEPPPPHFSPTDRDKVNWFFNRLRVIFGESLYSKTLPDAEMDRAARVEFGPWICQYSQVDLERALHWAKTGQEKPWLDIREILKSVEGTRPPPYHKPFERSTALEHKALPGDENAKRMAEMREAIGI